MKNAVVLACSLSWSPDDITGSKARDISQLLKCMQVHRQTLYQFVLQCLLDNLLLSKDEEGQGLSLQSLRDQLMTLLVAGQETSAILLGWTTAFLAHNPDVQRQAAAEVQQVLQGEAPTPDSVRYQCQLQLHLLLLGLSSTASMLSACFLWHVGH